MYDVCMLCTWIHMVFTTDNFLEVALESWLKWDLAFITSNQLSYQAMSLTCTHSQLFTTIPISFFLFSVRFYSHFSHYINIKKQTLKE